MELQEAAPAHPGRARRRAARWEEIETTSSPTSSCSPGRCSRPSAPTTRSCCSSTRSTASRSRPRRCCSRSSPTTRCRSPSSARSRPSRSRSCSSRRTTPVSCPRRSSAAASTSTSTTPTSSARRRSCSPRCPDITENLADQVARIVRSIRQLELKKSPSVSETLDWARTLLLLGVEHVDAETATAHDQHPAQVPERHRQGGARSSSQEHGTIQKAAAGK